MKPVKHIIFQKKLDLIDKATKVFLTKGLTPQDALCYIARIAELEDVSRHLENYHATPADNDPD